MFTNRHFLAALCALVTGLLVHGFVTVDVLGRVNQTDWYFQHSAETLVTQTQVTRGRKGVTTFKPTEKALVPGQQSRARFRLRDRPSPEIRVEFTGAQQSWQLEPLILHSAFTDPVTVPPGEIARYFRPANDETRIETVNGDHFLVTDGAVAALRGPYGFRFSSPVLAYLLPALAALLVYLAVFRWNVAAIPSIRLAHFRDNTSLSYSAELDGLRGLAAITVVADHTWGSFTGMGLVGVWIFFALSGYLLSIPFVRQPDRIFSFEYVSRFYLRRLARIVPMYYFTLFLYYIASGHVHLSVPHFLFLQGNGHLWTIPQEMIFYLVLPLIMLGMAFLVRLGAAAAILGLIVATGALLYVADDIPVRVYSENTSRPAYLAWFLGGIGVSWVLNNDAIRGWLDRTPDAWHRLVGWLALGVLVAALLLGTNRLSEEWFGAHTSLAIVTKEWFAPVAAFLVFAAVYARQTLYGRIMRSGFLRSYGILGFSVYLIHPLLLEILLEYRISVFGDAFSGPGLFVATMALTWLMASLTFNLVEYPFISGASAGKTAARRQAPEDP